MEEFCVDTSIYPFRSYLLTISLPRIDLFCFDLFCFFFFPALSASGPGLPWSLRFISLAIVVFLSSLLAAPNLLSSMRFRKISKRLRLSSTSSSSSVSSSPSDNHVDAEISFVQVDVELWVYRIQSWVCRSEISVHVVQGKLN